MSATPGQGAKLGAGIGKAIAFVALALGAFLIWRYGGAPPPDVQVAMERALPTGHERLDEKALLRPGDRLSLSVRSAEPLYVYVVNLDGGGTLAALFPYASLDRPNPLPAGEDVRLPGTQQGQPFSWEVTSRSGSERFLVIAAREHLADVESRLGQLAAGAPGPVADGATDALQALERELFPGRAPRDVHVTRLRFDLAVEPVPAPAG